MNRYAATLLVIGVAAGIGGTVIALVATKKLSVPVTTLKALTPGPESTFQSGVVQ